MKRVVGIMIVFVLIVILLVVSVFYYFSNASQAASMDPYHLSISEKECYIGNWENFDIPELTADWHKALKKAAIEATEISAFGYGENEHCIEQTVNGRIYSELPPTAAASVHVSAKISVTSLVDDEALGKIVTKIVEAMQSDEPYHQLSGAMTSLTFIADGSKGIRFELYTVKDLLQRGLTASGLFQALDGRYTPPTVTPVPPEG